ncbi:NAD-dependent DNA ligase LigA [Enterobacteriaceae endosymbiont of Donacia semicuprea]|uniref:NAD-dependent DNA ligase LigA n=1 Tax=Enterobacteriaceae endosymbiont of Donacia semicuprea TaxID=2675783 RepID=UPI00144A01C4|nr:NAD-dependent DNA ligase LigA [Enterobacteriaceae endosymbiont of Donacia semicuprea]QJC32729.1 NAD-dependent DNA ligase LigA [Enterobacteriaceae endosymbiont of Donacia semicuprea]
MVLYGKKKLNKNFEFYITKLMDILYKIYKVFIYKKRILQLRKIIIKHNYRYYILNNSSILDYQYDNLILKLKKLEKLFPYLKNKYSPTKLVGVSAPLIFLKKIHHKKPMLSLNNVFHTKDLIKKFLYPLKKLINKLNFCCELKFDGIAINLLYKNGFLIKASTRGNGFIGEDITEKIFQMNHIPHVLKKKFPNLLEVRGEVFITKKNFKILNKKIVSKHKLFSNTRSATLGILKLNKKNNNKMLTLLSFFSYGIGFIDKQKFLNQEEILNNLKLYGFPVSNYRKICSSYLEIKKFYEIFKNKRNFLPYSIDGIVVKINDIKIQEIIGNTTNAPRWAIAYKFPSQEKKTLLKKIIFQIGRTGIITPVAKFNTVNITGVNINSATLYNVNEIKKLNLQIGKTVIIQRCGDVIPKIIGVINEKKIFNNTKNIIIPKNCPSCNSILIKKNNNILYCKKGLSCKDQLKAYLKHFISKEVMNICFIGNKLIDKLVDNNLVKNIIDLMNLDNSILKKVNNLGIKSINKILKNLQKKKQITFDKFLFSLNIPEVGKVTSYNLSQFFFTLDKFLNTNLIELNNITGIGIKTSLNIYNFIKNKNNINIIQNLLKKIDIIYFKKIIKKNYFYKKNISITGKFSFITRINFINKLKKLGAKINFNINKKTDILILGKNSSSKLLKAHKLNIKILNEKKIIYLLKNNL